MPPLAPPEKPFTRNLISLADTPCRDFISDSRGVLTGIPEQCGEQPHVVQHGGSQIVGEVAGDAHDVGDEGFGFFDVADQG